MQNIYSAEYNKKYSKVGNFMASFGITLLITIGEIGMVIAIMTVKTIMAAVTTDSKESFDKAMDEIFSRSDFFAKTTLLITAVALIIVFTCYYFSYVKRDMRKGTYESVFPKLRDKQLIGFIICATVSAFGLAGILSGIISTLLPEKAESLTEVFEDLRLSGYLYFLDVVILGPIFEELVMRGLILKTSKKAYGMIGCMIINSIMFSCFHGNIIQGFYTIPIGLFYAFLAFQFNSVIPTIFCHMFHNLLSSFLNFGGAFGMILDILLFVIFGVIAYFLGKDYFPMFESKPVIPLQQSSLSGPASSAPPVRPAQVLQQQNTARPTQSMVSNTTITQKPLNDPSSDFSFFNNIPPKVATPKPAESVWKMNLIYRQRVDNVMRNTKFTEKVFNTKEQAEKWIASKGFVYGQNPLFKEAPEPYWFHRMDTRTDHVTVKIYEMKLNEGLTDNDSWITSLNRRTVQ